MSQTESLTDRTTRAAQWRFAGAGVAAVARFAIGIVLARLLSPADFGVVALAFVVLGLAGPLGDLGIGSAASAAHGAACAGWLYPRTAPRSCDGRPRGGAGSAGRLVAR